MSDFDKEAEREKLREKYEREKTDREATQRMSDLLLKGATMTNTHCNTCGDPLFRQNGTTFCPSCHGGPEGVEGPELAAETPSEEANPDESPDSSDEIADASDPEPPSTAPAEPRQASGRRPERSPEQSPSADETTESPPSTPDRSRTPSATPSLSGDRETPADLEDAHAALVRALERFAREAATTDDPRHATECLEAAHEAANALAALER